jgi:CRP-like cAMP-binding protein
MTNPLIAKLKTVAALSDDDQQAVEAICDKTRMIDKGRDIVREGETPEHIYYLLEGWAANYKVLPGGSRQITAFLLPGDLCDNAITVLRKMDHSVTALTPVTIVSIDRRALIRLTCERAGLAQAFWWTALMDQAVLRAWVVNVGRRDAYSRVAHQMCELHARMTALGLADDAKLNLPLTQEQLGDALGLTSVHINRVLKRLRNEGLMELHSRTLTILNTELLGAAAGFDPGYLQSSPASL